VQLVVPDQKLPVGFTVRAHVTTTDLVFSPPQLDFGPCVMAEDTGVLLQVRSMVMYMCSMQVKAHAA
jgi:hypothetical protein